MFSAKNNKTNSAGTADSTRSRKTLPEDRAPLIPKFDPNASPDPEPGYDFSNVPDHDDSPEAFEKLRRTEREDRRTGSRARVRWANDENAPDYAHALVAKSHGIVTPKTFKLTSDVIDLLIKANLFQAFGPNDKFVIALRGARQTGDASIENASSVELEDVRPNHRNFRCMIGFYDRANGKISAYRSSTVPNESGVRSYHSGRNSGNMMPNGCYIYRNAAHKRGTIRPALRMCNPDNLKEDGTATVLRSRNNLVYTHDDIWDPSEPLDNVHCAYKFNSFSSFGCLTVQGPNSGSKGPWKQFQKHIRPLPWNEPMSLVLLTGLDAGIAAEIIRQGRQDDNDLVRACLCRLRVGSQGEIVRQLQLKIKFTGNSDYFGPSTRARLTQHEKKHNVNSDGTYCPADDEATGWNLFQQFGDSAIPNQKPGQQPGQGDGQQTPSDAKPTQGDGTTAIDPASITLVAMAGGNLSADGKTLTVAGEGVWNVGPGIGQVTFKPEEDFVGSPKPARYKAITRDGNEVSALISVTVKRVNKAPQLKDDTASTPSGQAIEVAVLKNDADLDGTIKPETMRFANIPHGAQLNGDRILSVPGKGAWTINDGGILKFEPTDGFVGVSSIDYEVSDNEGAKSIATAKVTVTPKFDPVELVDDTGETPQGQPVTIDVLKNDKLGTAIKVPAGQPEPKPKPTPTPQQPDQQMPDPAGPRATVPIKEQDLKTLSPGNKAEKFRRALVQFGDKILANYAINANPLRMAHFMAQVGHESGRFTIETERLDYKTPRRLMQVWPTRFHSISQATPFIDNEVALGDKVYGGRLGNNRSGDGFKYRGRGLIQLTGRESYRIYGRKLDIPLEVNPDLAAEPINALRIAAQYWHDRKLNRYADKNDINTITRKINGGHIGLTARKKMFNETWSIWGTGTPTARTGNYMSRGDKGPKVIKLQEQLKRAGYLPGKIDGDFGSGTERAVMRFQLEHNLNVDGTVDKNTRTKLDAAPKVTVDTPPPATRRGGRNQRKRGKRQTRSHRRDDPYSGWGEIVRLVTVLAGLALTAWLVLSKFSPPQPGAPTESSIWWITGLALLAIAFFASFQFDPRDDLIESSDYDETDMYADEYDADAQASNLDRRAPVDDASKRFQETDQKLRRLGFDNSYFKDDEPIRAMPGMPDEVELDGLDEATIAMPPAQQIAAQLDNPAPSERASSSAPIAPYDVRGHDAQFLLITMFGGDNDLTNQVEKDLSEMAAGNRGGGSVAVLGLADLLDAPATVVEITPSGERRTVAQLGEIDTGDPETLADFLARALISYRPGIRKAIGFWDHGSGTFDEEDPHEVLLTRSMRNRRPDNRQRPARHLFIPADQRKELRQNPDTRSMLDDWSSGGVLTNIEAGRMLNAAYGRAGISVEKAELMFSDTCLNGMVEVMAELGDYSDAIIASADLEPAAGWDYERWLSHTNRLPPSATSEDWARVAVDAFHESYLGNVSQYPCTLAAFDTDNDIVERFAELVDLVMPSSRAPTAGHKEWALLNVARANAQDYDNLDSYDLMDFAAHLENVARLQNESELMQRAGALKSAVARARIHFTTLGPTVRDSQGLAFWFPSSRSSLRRDITTYRRLEFARTTGWARYLEAMYLGIV